MLRGSSTSEDPINDSVASPTLHLLQIPLHIPPSGYLKDLLEVWRRALESDQLRDPLD